MRVDVKRAGRLTMVVALGGFLFGCAATNTLVDHRQLSVSTKISEPIFLEPADSAVKTAFVSVRNTSGVNGRLSTLEESIKARLKTGGYRIVSNPKEAYVLLQANVLSFGEANGGAAKNTLDAGFGGALAGGLVGATAGTLIGERSGAITGGLIGSAAGFAANTLIKDKTYVMVIDVQLGVRLPEGQTAKRVSRASLKQGMATREQVNVSGISDRQFYRTRVVSTANQMNLTTNNALASMVPSVSAVLSEVI